MDVTSDTADAALARQRMLSETHASLPLGRHGVGIGYQLRGAGPLEQARIAATWWASLLTLHHAGWGTDDAVAGALVTELGSVHFLPDLVWPLGTTVTRRPVARWIDLSETYHFLAENYPSAAMELSAPSPPWPGWPAPPGPGASVVIGATLEVAALALHAGVSWVAASRFDSDQARAATITAIERALPFVVPVTDVTWARRLPLVPRQVVRVAEAAPTSVALTPEMASALGMDFAALQPPRAAVQQASTQQRARQAEDIALLESDEARAAAQAKLLIECVETLEGSPGEEGFHQDLARLGEAIDLGRDARDRGLTFRATLMRGTLQAASPEPQTRRAGLSDLAEARRLAEAAGDMANAATASSAHLLSQAVDARVRDRQIALPDNAPWRARAWALLAEAARRACSDGGATGLLNAPELLTIALATGELSMVTAAIELTGAWAVALGREAQGERWLHEAMSARLPAACRPLCEAWIAILACRRGAPLSAREHLVAVAAAVEVRTERRDPWMERAASRAALAASWQGLDGLVQALSRVAPTANASRVARGEDVIAEMGEWPSWLIAVASEAVLDRGRENPIRQARQVVRKRVEPIAVDEWPAGMAFVLGRLEMAAFAADPARAALGHAAARGERHIELGALRALQTLLAESAPLSEEAQGVARRLASLEARLPLVDPDTLPPPPLTADGAAEDQAQLVRRAAEAAARGGWRAAVEALCGPLTAAPPERGEIEVGALRLVESGAGWTLEARGGRAVALRERPVASPQTVVRALEAIAPLVGGAPTETAVAPQEDAPENVWARQTHAALCEGSRDFDAAVMAPFKAHDLTRRAVRALLHLGLTDSGGLYRSLAGRWGIADADYQRFMDFLRRANVALDYRPYRRGRAAPPDA